MSHETAVLETPETAAVMAQALTWPEKARALTVTSDETYAAAADILKGIKALRGEVDAAFGPIVRAAFTAHRTAVEQKRKAEAPLTEAEAIIKRSLGDYNTEQQRLRDAQRREDERLAREAEEARVLAEAAAMESEGHQFGDEAMVAEAHAMIERPIVAAPIAPAPRPVPAVAGVSHRTTYSAEVTNFAQFVAHIAAHPNLLPLLQVNQTALNGQARSLKEMLSLPGVRVVKTNTVAAGNR
ncbi:MAG: hypothetical protein NUW22_04995 [Acidobacteria bacterium]|nr:hypothetical protein [Acidobacteriota bacterium]